MTTYVNTINVQHFDDTGFNNWVSEFITGLTAIGMIQTADTGQTTFGAIPRPGINSSAGFQIWRFDDAVHADGFPLYVRFEFRTDASPGDAAINFIVGTTTDGAGTLTGSVSDTFEYHSALAPASQQSGPIFMVHTEGFFGVYFGKGGVSTAQPRMAWFTGFVCRSCDAAGVPNAEAFFLTSAINNFGATPTSMETGPAHQSVDYSSGNKFGTNLNGISAGKFALLPGGDNVNSNVDDDGNVAIFPGFGANPHPFPIPYLVWGWLTDIPENLTFTATAVGVTQRTYISQSAQLMGGSGGQAVSEAEADDAMMAFMWE